MTAGLRLALAALALSAAGQPVAAAAPASDPERAFWAGIEASARDDRPAALGHMRAACDGGMSYGCFVLGELLLEAEEAEAARGSFLDACRGGGAPEGCTEYGRLLWQGVGGPPDAAGARAAFADGCETGDSNGCLRQGVLLEAGIGGAADAGAARAAYSEACERGLADACNRLGVMIALGAGAPADPGQARSILQRACEAGSPAACANRGAMLAAGLGGGVDRTRARSHLVSACSQGFAPGCANLDALIEAGRDGRETASIVPALNLLGCETGHAETCHVTTLMLDYPAAVQNREAAQRALDCVLGSPGACP